MKRFFAKVFAKGSLGALNGDNGRAGLVLISAGSVILITGAD